MIDKKIKRPRKGLDAELDRKIISVWLQLQIIGFDITLKSLVEEIRLLRIKEII